MRRDDVLTPEAVECRMIGLSTILEPEFETEERGRYRVEAFPAGVSPLRRIA